MPNTWLVVVFAGVALAAIGVTGLNAYRAQQSDNQTLTCKEAGASQIIAKGVRINRADGVYVISDSAGNTATYDKSAFAFCYVTATP